MPRSTAQAERAAHLLMHIVDMNGDELVELPTACGRACVVVTTSAEETAMLRAFVESRAAAAAAKART